MYKITLNKDKIRIVRPEDVKEILNGYLDTMSPGDTLIITRIDEGAMTHPHTEGRMNYR